jgi:hypothetical protein
MRSVARLVLAAVVAGAAPVLSACDSLSLDTFEIWDSKKKLAGERKPVFPEGVPGVVSGVPPELVKGYHEPEGGPADPAKAAAEAAANQAAAKPKKPPPQRTASKPKPPPADDVQPQPRQATPQAAPSPWPSQQPQPAWPGGR